MDDCRLKDIKTGYIAHGIGRIFPGYKDIITVGSLKDIPTLIYFTCDCSQADVDPDFLLEKPPGSRFYVSGYIGHNVYQGRPKAYASCKAEVEIHDAFFDVSNGSLSVFRSVISSASSEKLARYANTK